AEAGTLGCRRRAPTGTGHVLHFAHEFLESGCALDGRLSGYSCRRRARVSRCRYAIRRLSHRSGAHVHGTTRRGGHWRAPPHSRVPFAPTRRGERDDRTDAGWCDRPQPHQCRADRVVDSGGKRARAAVSVPLVRTPSQCARSIDRQRNPGRLAAPRFCRLDFLRFGIAVDLQQRAAHPRARRHEGIANSGPAIRADGRDDQGARCRTDRATLWAGIDRPLHQIDRRRRKQLALLCHHKSLQARPYYTQTQHTMGPELRVMSPRAWESLSAEDQTIFRDAARKSSAYMRGLWTGLEERSREQARAAGNTIITDFDRTPFEQAMNTI